MNPTIFLAALVAFGLVMAGMAIGVILSDRRIAGSCGGLSNMKDRLGEPMCECGAKPGESCGRDDGKTYDFPADTAVVPRSRAQRESATV
ncbi:MAG: (Na+)-NQR maturation NqrM [Gemmatimonadetes bacterium]|jgi:uncharacterized protein|nr:(Na+)-NQR maturation NqrM [Gemmatimonadota bacterium]MBT6146230.1 (Na+)-NQR maturation NqrM [Gemmatimonadota bacterium]